MKLLYTEQAIYSFEEALLSYASKISDKKLTEIRNEVLDAADSLVHQPFKGQVEPLLEHIGLGHRRLIAGHFKILYRVVGNYIYVTDIFDSRQDPVKMKE